MDIDTVKQIFTEFVVLTTLIWLFFAAAVACSAVRFHRQQKRFGHLLLEDYIHIFSLSQLVAGCVMTYLSTALPINPQLSETYFDLAWDLTAVTSVFYVTTLYSVKAMFLAFYWRIFNVSPTYRAFWWFSVAFTTCCGLAVLLSNFWQCGNINNFGKWQSEACQSQRDTSAASIVVTLAFNISSDLIIFIMPLVMLCRSQMAWSKKSRVALIIILGMVTIVIDALNWIFQLGSYEASNIKTVVGEFLQYIEPSIAVTVACLPVLLSMSGQQNRPSTQGRQPAGSRTLSLQNRWLRAGGRGRRQQSSVLEPTQEQPTVHETSTGPKLSGNTTSCEHVEMEQQ